MTLRFVKSLYHNHLLSAVVLTIATVNVSLGSVDGQRSQVVLALVTMAIVLGFRYRFVKKPGVGIYENDPNSGKNET